MSKLEQFRSFIDLFISFSSDIAPPLPERNYYDEDLAGEYTELRIDAKGPQLIKSLPASQTQQARMPPGQGQKARIPSSSSMQSEPGSIEDNVYVSATWHKGALMYYRIHGINIYSYKNANIILMPYSANGVCAVTSVCI